MKNNQINEIKKVQISILTAKQIHDESHGEVNKPETINYKTHKPEKGGLFDEKIFGPIKDYRCPICGKKHKRADSGKLCSNCGEATIYPKSVRRRHMGHIQLYSEVANIWFTKIDYSIIGALLELKQDELESIIYFKSHIIYDNAGMKNIKVGQILDIKRAPSIYKSILETLLKDSKNDVNLKTEIEKKIHYLIESSQSEIEKTYGIDFHDYNEFISEFSNVKIGTGAEVIKLILKNLDLKAERKAIHKKLKTKSNAQNNSLLRRLKIIESFIYSEQDPSEMIFSVLPVIPADLRPLIQLDGGRHSTVDINELYRRIIIRNNRLKQWIDMEAPILIIQNEKRMLQEAVDALIDNSRKKIPVQSKDNRPLKSLAENLKGKQGRFRQNLLGKRVDYSGRSVIVVGPELRLHQVGLPKEMIVKLFEPFIVNLLVRENIVKNIKQAKKLIEVLDDRIWKYASRVIREHPVMLNRAPTLHRLSIQAFEPIIVSGKAIRLHPLVTPSFNADFDGDQMAVHVPISRKAKEEAWNLMLSNKNILGAKDGKLILSPSQDIILGLYYLTKTKSLSPNSNIKVFDSINAIKNELELEILHIQDQIVIPTRMYFEKFENDINEGKNFLITTVGRVLLNDVFPANFPYLNTVTESSFNAVSEEYLIDDSSKMREKFENANASLTPFKKAQISLIIETIFERNQSEIADVLDEIKSLGFNYSMISGTSMAVSDILEIENRSQIISEGDKQVEKLNELYNEGFLTDDQRYLKVLDVWSSTKNRIQKELEILFNENKDNSLFMMMNSGARSNITNIVQLAGLRGSMSKATHEYAALKRQNILVRSIEEIPIKSSFKTGLNPFEYFLSTHGARKGLSDTATKTAESGYLTRRLVDAVQDVYINEQDCGTNKGIYVTKISDTRTNAVIETLRDRVVGRNSSENVYDSDNNLIVAKDELITKQVYNLMEKNGITKIGIRSSLTCNSINGICQKCYGLDLTTHKEISQGEAIGIISAQSIGEPGTQLTMRTFHTGGVAGVADITQGFARLMELVDANKNPKSPSVISKTKGKVISIEKTPSNVEVIVENDIEKISYNFDRFQTIRVKEGDILEAGKKITEGSIQLQQLLKYAGNEATQTYLIKEIQKLYRLQGIEITDRYIEIIIRQMLSKIQITDPGQTDLYVGQVVSTSKLIKSNMAAFEKGHQPAFGHQVIYGVKPLPLQSESFLAAASYQRTSEALVNAAIIKKVDNLYGIKENLILGKQIPVGTGMEHLSDKFNFFENDESNSDDENYNDFEFKRPKAYEENGYEFRVVNEETEI